MSGNRGNPVPGIFQGRKPKKADDLPLFETAPRTQERFVEIGKKSGELGHNIETVVEGFKRLAEGTANGAFNAPIPEAEQKRRDDNATHDIKARVHRNMGRKDKPGGKAYWAEKARAFRKANPHVWDTFVQLCEMLINKGHKRFGVELIFNVMRWQTMLETTDDTGFKLNSNYKSAFARMFMEEYPQHEGVFETRESAGGVDF